MNSSLPRVPLISLEDHYVSREIVTDHPGFDFNLFGEVSQENLKSLGQARIEALDRGNVSIQVASLIPVNVELQICQQANDQCSKAAKESHGRLQGFAALPMSDPEAAAQELERCVRDLGFPGALIPNHADGTYFDGLGYRDFWKTAEKLDIPIYIHPCPPTKKQSEAFEGQWPYAARSALSTYAWGWHADVSLHILRLYTSGLFEPENCPNLKIIIGHAGEMLPFMVGRTNRTYNKVWTQDTLQRPLDRVWRENIWVTLSGMWDLAPLACLLRTTSVDKIMYSNDWPLEDEVEGMNFMEEVRKSGLVTEAEYELMAYKNAQTLLKLDGYGTQRLHDRAKN